MLLLKLFSTQYVKDNYCNSVLQKAIYVVRFYKYIVDYLL